MYKTGRFGWALLMVWLAAASFASAQVTDSNCAVPVDIVDSCDVGPTGCWIETDEVRLPWLVETNPTSKNPRDYRAFCSEANASGGTAGHWYTYSVYLPPGYDLPENADVRYPVVYWFSGRLASIDKYTGRGTNVAKLVHKRITQRAIRPTIYVFPYGGVDTSDAQWSWIDQWTDGDGGVSPGCDPDRSDVCFRADSAFDELVAHIEANYRVIENSQGRALQGFSRGGGFVLQRAYRTVDGDYLAGSIAAISAAAKWEGSRFEPDAEELAIEYANSYPDDDDRPMQLMAKHGDFGLDQSAIATADFSDFLSNELLESTDAGVEAISHELEHVVPQCGEEREYAPPCGPNEQPPVLGHQQIRMTELRGDEIIAFHQQSFAQLTEDELAVLDSHQLPCAAGLPYITEEPVRFDPMDSYFVGDWDGDGCDSIAVRYDGEISKDNNYDDSPDETVTFGPDDATYFAIDWYDTGVDELAYAQYDTAACNNSWEIRFYTDDRDGDGHDVEKDEPFFCFEDAPAEAEFLVGDFDGDFRDDVAYRMNNNIYWTPFLASGHDGTVADSTKYGMKTEDQWAAGRWFYGQTTSSLAVRRGNQQLLNAELDGGHELDFKYGGGAKEDQYLYGDWDGDGRTNVAVRRCNQFLLDVDFDGQHDFQYYYGWGTPGACD